MDFHKRIPSCGSPAFTPGAGHPDKAFPLWRLLDPRSRILPLFGRQSELEELHRWYRSSRTVSVRTVAGGPGVGKTRLATELIAQIADRNPEPHDARFAGPTDWMRLTRSSGSTEWLWQRPTLLVVDHAALEAEHLRRLLASAEAQAQRPIVPLRILFLERHGSPDEGWLRFVQEKSSKLFDNLRPTQLGPVPIGCARRSLVKALRQALVEAHLESRPVAHRLEEPPTDPRGPSVTATPDLRRLLMTEGLAACRELDQRGSACLTRAMLAWVLANLEADRLARHAPPHAPYGGRWMVHLAACATILGGISCEDVVGIAKAEQRALHWPSPGAEILAERLQSALSVEDGNGLRIGDELLGEALVLLALGRQALGSAGKNVLRRLNSTGSESVASSLARLAVDFSDPAFPEPLEWLSVVLENTKAPPIGWLLEVDRALPAGVPGLRAFTFQLSEQLLAAMRLRSEGFQSLALSAESARLMGRLSWRLADLGRPQAGLDAAQQAERALRRIAAMQPRLYRNDWVDALEVLAVRLSELGQSGAAAEIARMAEACCAAAVVPGAVLAHELSGQPSGRCDSDATPPAQDPWRALVCRSPCTPPAEWGSASSRARWAASLLVCSAVLAQSGHNLEARIKTARAVAVYRELADGQPEAFLPQLLASQSRLAVLIASCGEAEAAVSTVREAELTYRFCCFPYPTWSLAEWAKALGVMADFLGGTGSDESALPFATQAAEIWRTLAVQQPGAFMPDLGRALCHLAVRLDACHRQQAAASWAEAEEAYRALAEVEPGTFLPEVAVTLLNHALGLARASEWETALLKAKEAERIFQSLAQVRPTEFAVLWARALTLQATCYRSLPHRALEIEDYGTNVVSWWVKLHCHCTLAGPLPELRKRPIV